jgi:hypothetical protein
MSPTWSGGMRKGWNSQGFQGYDAIRYGYQQYDRFEWNPTTVGHIIGGMGVVERGVEWRTGWMGSRQGGQWLGNKCGGAA